MEENADDQLSLSVDRHDTHVLNPSTEIMEKITSFLEENQECQIV